MGGFDEIVDTFVLIRSFESHEEQQAFVARESEAFARRLLVAWHVEVGVDSVRYAHHLVPLRQRSLISQFAEPFAARHKMYLSLRISVDFVFKHAVGKVALIRAHQQSAVVAVRQPVFTLLGMVANARDGPHIVHCPYHGLPRLEDFCQIAQGKHPLVYPMEMNEVCFFKFAQLSDVHTMCARIDSPEVLA